jgi:hypothetical protein
LERDEELAMRALEAEVAGSAAPLDGLAGERFVAVRALDLDRPLLLDPAHDRPCTRCSASPYLSDGADAVRPRP